MARPKRQAGQDLAMVDNNPQVGKVQGEAGFTPKGLNPEPKPGFTVYRVNRPILQLSNTDKIYLVANGLVDLPDGENWYIDLINNGVLTPL